MALTLKAFLTYGRLALTAPLALGLELALPSDTNIDPFLLSPSPSDTRASLEIFLYSCYLFSLYSLLWTSALFIIIPCCWPNIPFRFACVRWHQIFFAHSDLKELLNLTIQNSDH